MIKSVDHMYIRLEICCHYLHRTTIAHCADTERNRERNTELTWLLHGSHRMIFIYMVVIQMVTFTFILTYQIGFKMQITLTFTSHMDFRQNHADNKHALQKSQCNTKAERNQKPDFMLIITVFTCSTHSHSENTNHNPRILPNITGKIAKVDKPKFMLIIAVFTCRFRKIPTTYRGTGW